jgi:hypothetical protein
MVTESKPRRPWQKTIGFFGVRSKMDGELVRHRRIKQGRTFSLYFSLLLLYRLVPVLRAEQSVDILLVLRLEPPTASRTGRDAIGCGRVYATLADVA